MTGRNLRNMGWFLAGVLLACVVLVSTANAANPFNDARAATRLLVTEKGQKCSAVVIAPGVALTAKHCVGLPVTVDGRKATVTRVHPVEDVAELSVPGLACPCVKVSAVRPGMDETIIAVGYLYGDLLLVSRGEYLGFATNAEDGASYGVFMGSVGPGMSGGGMFRVFVTGEITLVGVMSSMAPGGAPGLYVEVSKDAIQW